VTALRLTQPDAPAGHIDFANWLTLDQAADKLGITAGRLRGKAPALAARGLATKAQAPGQSRPVWWIARQYDPRLWRGEAGRKQQPADLGQLTAKNRDLVRQRMAALDRFRSTRAAESRPVKDWLPELIDQLRADFPDASVSRSHLYEWDKVVRTPADAIELADGRGGDQYHDRYTEFWKRFELDFLDPNQPKVKHSYDRVRLEMRAEGADPKTIPSLRTVHRQLDDRIAPATQAYHRDREGEYKSRFLPTIQQDTERFAAGRCWVFDHTTMDLFVRAGERVFRPYLTTAQDWRTRKIVGWCLTYTPNSDSILMTLREGILDRSNMGGPEHICFDNGKDFDAWFFDGRTKQQRRRKVQNDWLAESSFRGIFAEMKIEPHFSIAYAPNGKARMERWYGYLHDSFERTFPTYCGKDTTSKPADLDKRLANLPGVPTYEQLHERLSDWVDAFNRRADHNIEDLKDEGLRLSPTQAMAAWCDTRRMFGTSDEHERGVLDKLLMHHDRPTSVGKTGVGITVAGSKLYFGLVHGVIVPELRGYQGHAKKKVRCAYDPRDLSAIHVYDDADGRLICIAPNNQTDSAGGRQRVAEAHRAIRAHHKKLADAGVYRGRPKLSALEFQLATDTLPDAPEPSTRSIKPVQTGFDQASKQAQEQQYKQAAGAEFDQDEDEPDILDALANQGGPSPTQDDEEDEADVFSLADFTDPSTPADGPPDDQEDDDDDTDVSLTFMPPDDRDEDDDDLPGVLDVLR
jgi:transposase InsO family protein